MNGVAAVDHHHLPMDHRGEITAQKHYDSSHILGGGQPAQRGTGEGPGEDLLALGKLFQGIGINDPGANGIDGDPSRSELHRQVADQ